MAIGYTLKSAKPSSTRVALVCSTSSAIPFRRPRRRFRDASQRCAWAIEMRSFTINPFHLSLVPDPKSSVPNWVCLVKMQTNLCVCVGVGARCSFANKEKPHICIHMPLCITHVHCRWWDYTSSSMCKLMHIPMPTCMYV